MACLHRKFGLCINEFVSIFDGIKDQLTTAKVWFFHLHLPNAASCIFIVVYSHSKLAG